MRLYRGIGCCIVAATLLMQAQATLDLNQDSRLNQRLSLRVAATPLKEIAAGLSRRTGVALSVQPELGEYRAFARLQNRPLHEIMQLLASAFDFEWRAERVGGQWRYVLTQSSGARTQEPLELAIAQRNLLQILREALELIPPELTESPDRRAYSRTYAELSAQKVLPQPTWQGELPSDFYRDRVLYLRHELLQRALAHSTGWFTLKLLANLSPEDWGRLQQQRVLVLPMDALPSAWLAEWQRGVREEGIPKEGGWRYTGQLPPAYRETTETDLPWMVFGGRVVEAIQDNLRAVVLAYDPQREWFSVGFCGALGEWTGLWAPLELTKSLLLTAEGRRASQSPSVRLIEKRAPPDSLTTPLRTTRDAAWARERDTRWVHWISYQLVDALEACQLEGVGEFYPLAITDRWIYFSLNSAYRLLAKCADTVYTVREEASAMVFAARERALARATDMPDAQLLPLAMLQPMDFDALAQIAARFTRTQLQVLYESRRGYLEVYPPRGFTGRAADDGLYHAYQYLAFPAHSSKSYLWLRWYAQLPEPLKQRLRQGEAIPLGELDAGLREGLRDALRCHDLLPACAEPPELDWATAVISLRVASKSALRGVQGQPSPQQVQYRNYRMEVRDARGKREALFVELPAAHSSP